MKRASNACGVWQPRCAPTIHNPRPRFAATKSTPPRRAAADLYELLSNQSRGDYEVRDVLDCLLDADSFDEYKPEFGQSLVCGTARLGGFSVGIVANQHHRVRPAAGPYQFGGVLYVDSAEKAARFVMNCNQDWLPIVFLQDVNGFMVGRDAERAGIIKAGAKLVSAISNSRVPKITVITGGSYGAGNYALCGKAFDPRFIFAWPTAHVAVMGGEQAAETLLEVAVKSLKRQGDEVDAAELEQLARNGDGRLRATNRRALCGRARLGRCHSRSRSHARGTYHLTRNRHAARRA